MLGRLLIGIVKGLIVGALIAFGLGQLGLGAPGALFAYVAAAVTGILVGLVAGKPIWAKDARIEAGMKAFVGALLAAGLMYVTRRWLTMSVPPQLATVAGPTGGETAFGGLAITSLPAIAALLAGFYEVDNTPEDEAPSANEGKAAPRATPNKRIAANADDLDLDEDLDADADRKRAKK
ncbi:hypothetical protein [Chondromyces crocatus]|uniref:Uncharacterized protein n=1 Tax=Chondromyces crocatus TaxID=52 RepID=A0A0K1E5V2_CHOCO|nr:hypothetical protein [Chondromyces crocatus]AKT36256.1 uncharacterized protein CMC5_003700 [Chondromyces crocatus]